MARKLTSSVGASLFVVCSIAASVSFAEDCVSLNPVTAKVSNIQGSWKIVDGSHWVFDFAGDKASADKSLAVIKHYGMNQSCFVGRPNPSFKYMMISGHSPTGAMAGEDCLPFNPATIKVAFISNDWKIVDGNHWIFSFGNKQAEAQQAFAIIKQKGFSQTCYVGRPNPHFSYLKASGAATVAPARNMTSCMKKLSIDTQISNDYLHRAVNALANSVNLNKVDVDIAGSNINAGVVNCHYKSLHNDIPNLVYNYPCKDARKENTGYAHSYSCAK